MQYIIPLVIINMIITSCLFYRVFVKKSRRPRRREELARWRSQVDLRLKQVFEAVVQGDFLNDIVAEQSRIKQDLAKLSKGVFDADVKIGVCQQALALLNAEGLLRRVDSLEHDTEAIKDTIDDLSKGRTSIDLIFKYESLGATIETLRIQHSGLSADLRHEIAKMWDRIIDLENDLIPARPVLRPKKQGGDYTHDLIP